MAAKKSPMTTSAEAAKTVGPSQKRKWYVVSLVIVCKSWAQILIGLVAAALTAYFVAYRISPNTANCASLLGGYIPLLSILAAVFALGSSLLVGHTLQFVNNTAQEKASLYNRFRDVLYRLDDFLRLQDQENPLIEMARIISWDLKRAEREEFPLQDWEKRLSGFEEAIEAHKKQETSSNLHLEIIAFLDDCEQVHNELALCWIKQLVAPLLLQSAIKMLVLLSSLLVALFLLISLTPQLSLYVQVGVPTFFVVAAILVSVELGFVVWRHVRDMTEESLSGFQAETN
jgi:ABC-type multidrug transport system fused ATPase/permease subunit